MLIVELQGERKTFEFMFTDLKKKTDSNECIKKNSNWEIVVNNWLTVQLPVGQTMKSNQASFLVICP